MTVTTAPLIDTAALVPLMVRAAPLEGVAVTMNALPAGAEVVSRASSKVTDSAVPFTPALWNCGAAVSGVRLVTGSKVKLATTLPRSSVRRSRSPASE